jgi:hypothetical protein
MGRHSSERWNPEFCARFADRLNCKGATRRSADKLFNHRRRRFELKSMITAFAEMAKRRNRRGRLDWQTGWIPAFAGMTNGQ